MTRPMNQDQVSSQQLIEALGVPPTEGLADRVAEIGAREPWRHSRAWMTVNIARACWRRWHPDQSGRADDAYFIECFRDFLADGIRLGYNIERFRLASSKLPPPSRSARNWLAFFEEAIAGDDCGTFRLLLSREQY